MKAIVWLVKHILILIVVSLIVGACTVLGASAQDTAQPHAVYLPNVQQNDTPTPTITPTAPPTPTATATPTPTPTSDVPTPQPNGEKPFVTPTSTLAAIDIVLRPVPYEYELLIDGAFSPTENTNVTSAHEVHYAVRHSSGTGYTQAIWQLAIMHSDTASATADFAAWWARVQGYPGCVVRGQNPVGDESHTLACYTDDNRYASAIYYVRVGNVRLYSNFWSKAANIDHSFSAAELYARQMIARMNP